MALVKLDTSKELRRLEKASRQQDKKYKEEIGQIKIRAEEKKSESEKNEKKRLKQLEKEISGSTDLKFLEAQLLNKKRESRKLKGELDEVKSRRERNKEKISWNLKQVEDELEETRNCQEAIKSLLSMENLPTSEFLMKTLMATAMLRGESVDGEALEMISEYHDENNRIAIE